VASGPSQKKRCLLMTSLWQGGAAHCNWPTGAGAGKMGPVTLQRQSPPGLSWGLRPSERRRTGKSGTAARRQSRSICNWIRGRKTNRRAPAFPGRGTGKKRSRRGKRGTVVALSRTQFWRRSPRRRRGRAGTGQCSPSLGASKPRRSALLGPPGWPSPGGPRW
jgi:hypothetical protein